MLVGTPEALIPIQIAQADIINSMERNIKTFESIKSIRLKKFIAVTECRWAAEVLAGLR